MDYKLKSLKNPQNTKAGIAEFALLALAADFAVNGIKAPVAPFTAPGDSLTIKNAHEFLPTKAFAKFDLAPQKNQLSYKSVGDTGFKSFNSEVEIFIAGSYAEAHEAVKGLLNQKLIVLVKDSECAADMYYQLGCDCQFAYLAVDFSTGFTNNGVKGFKGTITYDDGPQFYKVAGGPAVLSENPQNCPVLVLENTDTTVKATWPNYTNNTFGYVAVLYDDIYGTVVNTTAAVAPGVFTHTFTGLDPDTTYYLKISPKDAAGNPISGCGIVGVKTEV